MGKGTSIASKIISPIEIKNNKTSVAVTAALRAIFFLSFLSRVAVTAIKTGIVPIGSITLKKVMNEVISASIIKISFY